MLEQERRPTLSTRLRASGSLAVLVAVALFVAFVSALFVGGARSASAPHGLIAFTRDGDDGVYIMEADGSGVRLLWRGARAVTDLAWSPDGSKLAVTTSGRSIWVVNVDGTDPVRVARVGASSLSWSADGRRIAFTSKDDIWLMNADGSNIRPLERTPRLSEKDVDWKPTGGWVAFATGGYVSQVYVVRTNGTNLRNLPTIPEFWYLTYPDWSPDGRRIVLTSCASDTNCEVWVTNASGNQRVQLTKTKDRVHDVSPVWSPDGRRIAFLRGDYAKSGSFEIYAMNADGTGVTRLTHNRVDETSLAWQPVAPTED